MKLVSIELYNIGLYKNQAISFETGKKSTCLFWGNNGSGKTTFINSIKVGLLGHKAFSFSYDEYVKFIKNNLISSRCSESNIRAGIKICIEMKEQNELRNYYINRDFSVKNEVLEENVNVFYEDEKLDFIEKEELLNRVEQKLPPSLLDVIIFDGESAINIINNNEIHKLIRSIVYAVFGMDIYANLIKDLNMYLKNMSNDSTDSGEDQLKLVNMESRYRESVVEYNAIASTLETYNKQKISIMSTLTMLLRRLSEKTGVKFDEIADVKNELNSLQSNKKNLDDEIRYVNEEVLPLKLLCKNLRLVLEEIEKERPYLILNNIHVLQKYFAQDEKTLKKLYEMELSINREGLSEIKYNISEADLERLNSIDSLLKEYSKEKLSSYFSIKNTAFDAIKTKVASLEKLNDKESKEIISSIEEIDAKIFDIQGEIFHVESHLAIVYQERETAKRDYESYKKTLFARKKESNSYVSILLYKEAIEEFFDLNIEDICKKLTSEVYYELRRIGFRNESITNVFISPKTFEVKLFEDNGRLIPSNSFSAGEKQILLGMVLKQAIALSKIDTFFLFDTPVGRLDISNRSLFTNEVILKVSDQVGVFATDSDYSKEDYKQIKPLLTKEMKLVRNSKDQIVVNPGSIY